MPNLILPGTSYVTTASGVRTTGNFNADFIVRDVAKEIALLEPCNYPLMAYMYLGNKKWRITAHPLTKFEWGEDELVQNLDAVSGYVSGAGSTLLEITPATIVLYHIGKRVRFEHLDQTGVVTTVATTITVLRDGGGNWKSIATGLADTNIHILGEAMSENQSPPTPISTQPSMLFNYCEIFSKKISMTERLIMAAMNGGLEGGNDYTRQLDMRKKEQKRDIEQTLWLAGEATAVATGGIYRTGTAGVFHQIEAGGGQIATYTGNFVEDNMDSAAKKKKYGSNKGTMFCGLDLAADIEKIVKQKYGYMTPIKKYGAIEGSDNVNVIAYETMGKSVDIVRCPLWEGKYSSWAAWLDDAYVRPVHAADDHKGSRKMRLEVNIETPGDPRREAQYKADIGIEVGLAPAHVIIRPL